MGARLGHGLSRRIDRRVYRCDRARGFALHVSVLDHGLSISACESLVPRASREVAVASSRSRDRSPTGPPPVPHPCPTHG
ncbi:hypothetical protein DB30_00543 [Enhygromyxa salina]|uniref:Uncharacterized protein n=1 Tax=Enhygromyxa salina TaxID=215803 RepID=A0A0C1ZPZ8_9BACT|nr:hypothetical protein DB30_00543 [Enhygromyxa salina]